MIVMCANSSNSMFHYLCGKVEGKVGWLLGPSSLKKTLLQPWVPFACDNDRYSAWNSGNEWCEKEWKKFVERTADKKPLWYLVPDSVGNRDETLKMWDTYRDYTKQHGPVAFAAQDGMTISDIPECDIVFVGGTTEWKWRNVGLFAKAFKRVHVGRVSTIDRLKICEKLGIESTDSTGWFKDGNKSPKAYKLMQYLLGKNKFIDLFENSVDTQTVL